MKRIHSMDRRSFCKLAAGTVAFLAGGSLVYGKDLPSWLRQSPAADLASELPSFDGVFVFDSQICRSMADDFGHFIHRMPIGVLFPRSAQDVQKVVQFAARKNIKVAMRGFGCSAYGQTQVLSGIVVNTAGWDHLEWAGPNQIDALPGASWRDVLEFSWPRRMTPAILPDTLFLTVGGSLSAGGIGETSYRLGGGVDHIVELDVVTASGDLVRCSPNHNSDLFHALLGGMGQCGLVVRARIQLQPAPSHVAVREIAHLNGADMLDDLSFIARSEPHGALAGNVNRAAGGWTFSISATTWLDDASEPTAPAWLDSIKGRAGIPKIVSYYDYANRRTKSYLDSVANGSFFVPHPYMSFHLPESNARAMSEFLTTNADASLGAAAMPIFPMLNNRFSRPLFQMPAGGDLSFHFRIYRKPATEGSPDHLKMLRINNEMMVPRVFADGGKFYLPHVPVLTPPQLREHYGPSAWNLLTDTKTKFDPGNLLNPGAGIFS